MFKLEEISQNLINALNKYDNLPLDDVLELSEILRTIGVNLSFLVHLRDDYYKSYQSVYFNSKGTSNAAKDKEAEMKVPELDYIRKILRHYGEVQRDIRSQISLRKQQDK